jgi:hypothetical protein
VAEKFMRGLFLLVFFRVVLYKFQKL